MSCTYALGSKAGLGSFYDKQNVIVQLTDLLHDCSDGQKLIVTGSTHIDV